jgi:phospholipid-binding lipoprotein MlaA
MKQIDQRKVFNVAVAIVAVIAASLAKTDFAFAADQRIYPGDEISLLSDQELNDVNQHLLFESTGALGSTPQGRIWLANAQGGGDQSIAHDPRDGAGGNEEISDPAEDMNRGFLSFNDVFDRFIIGPISSVYGFIAPEFVQIGILNIFENLGEPANIANSLLQGEFDSARDSSERFLLNTTIGVGGFVDFADQLGLDRSEADFGQTLYVHGVGPGPYLVLPLLGPTTTRDGVGKIVDLAADPLAWITLGNTLSVAFKGVDGVSRREEVGDNLKRLKDNSVDWYSTLRSVYYQDRRSFLNKGVVTLTDINEFYDEFENLEDLEDLE